MYENAFTGGLVYWKRNWVYGQNVNGKKRLFSVPAVWLGNSNIHSFIFLFLVLEFHYYRNSECWDLKHWHSMHLKRCGSLIHYVILLRLRERITLCNYLCSSSPSSRFSTSLIRNIGELGAKKYFRDHRTADTTQLFVPIKRKFLGSIPFQNKSQRGRWG